MSEELAPAVLPGPAPPLAGSLNQSSAAMAKEVTRGRKNGAQGPKRSHMSPPTYGAGSDAMPSDVEIRP